MMHDDINEFCERHGVGAGKPLAEKLEFLNDQWGMFAAWMREKYPVRVLIEVRGGVAYDMGNHPGAEVEIMDHD